MKLYTKTGDDGTTGLFGGARVPKDHPRVEAYGQVDELNSVLGVVRSSHPVQDVDAELATLQSELFDLGAELATAPGQETKTPIPLLAPEHVTHMELAIDRFEAELPPLQNFILPAGNETAARLHWARTVCRRMERSILSFALRTPKANVRPLVLEYINRLSDLLFVMARIENHRASVPEEPWNPRSAG